MSDTRSADFIALEQELRERLERAVVRLEEKRDDPMTRGVEKARLGGKVEGVKLALAYLHDEQRVSGAYQQNPDGSWSPATPLPWLEEHGPVARFIFWVRGIGHCGKPGRRFA